MNTTAAITLAFVNASLTLGVPPQSIRDAAIKPLAATITAPAPASALPNKFFYDLATGKCVNPHGQNGLNKALAPEVLAETKDGECMDLRGVSLNGDNLAYPRLKDWNLRGADLRGARLFFASLVDADLRGANLVGMLYGYAHITGTIDPFTQGLKACVRKDDPTQLSCVR